jgi:hypothetical protein
VIERSCRRQRSDGNDDRDGGDDREDGVSEIESGGIGIREG